MSAEDFSPDNIKRTAFFTGHRDLPEEEKTLVSDRLHDILLQAYEAGYRRFYCGAALGFDTVAAYQTICLRNRYPDAMLSLVIPCADQTRYWQEKDCETYRQLISLADEVKVLSPYYFRGIMLERNRYMADRSSVCICYLRRMRGGTASAVRYALLRRQMRIINLAVCSENETGIMRENIWNCMFISPSVSKNAGTVPLCLMRQKNLTMKDTSDSF